MSDTQSSGKQALGPFFERFFILGRPRGTQQEKTSNKELKQKATFVFFILSTRLSLTIRVDPF
jgi:hypothetical protein